MFYLQRYYNQYLESVIVNDVDVQYYYLGKMIELLGAFDMIEFEELEQPSEDWNLTDPNVESSPILDLQ